jgi:hypothetical protein
LDNELNERQDLSNAPLVVKRLPKRLKAYLATLELWEETHTLFTIAYKAWIAHEQHDKKPTVESLGRDTRPYSDGKLSWAQKIGKTKMNLVLSKNGKYRIW